MPCLCPYCQETTREVFAASVSSAALKVQTAYAADHGLPVSDIRDDAEMMPYLLSFALEFVTGAIESCAERANDAAKEAERIGKLHEEGSPCRDRQFARSREVSALADVFRERVDYLREVIK